MQRRIKVVPYSAAILGVLLMSGCWWFTLQPVQAPYITREPPYTAMLQFPYERDERILDVTVREELGARHEHTFRFSTCWQIKAIEPVQAAGFEVQIGLVPQGFTEVVPGEGESFKPVSEGKYVLKVTTTNRRADYCTWWTPGR